MSGSGGWLSSSGGCAVGSGGCAVGGWGSGCGGCGRSSLRTIGNGRNRVSHVHSGYSECDCVAEEQCS